jgi:hypothetical protein
VRRVQARIEAAESKHAEFTHEQTYLACTRGGAGGVAADLCTLHGEARVHGRVQACIEAEESKHADP